MWKPLDVAQHLLAPLLFMSLSACFFPITIYNLITSLQFSVLFSPSAFKDAWFANFWEKYGPGTRENATLNAQPLIAQSRGVVLDIGPGSGEWLHLFPKGKVSRIYGVEPNKDHHELLRKRVKAAGLTDVYVIVPVGVEHLGENWVGLGEVDTVVTIQCLCSVPQPKEMIRSLYGYLREGGQWIVYEHVITHQGGLIAMYQALIDLVWPHFLGGCSITRDTEYWLRETGDWSKIELKQPEAEPSYKVIPHVMGVLIK